MMPCKKGTGRRLLFLIGFFPVAIFALFRWVCTGESGMDFLQRFDDWSNE